MPGAPRVAGDIRVLVVEDHPLMASALRSLLRDQDGMEVVGVAATASAAVTAAEAASPDVVLMDHRLSESSGVDAARAIRDACAAAVIFISADPGQETMLAAVEAGACGYIVKSEPPERIIEAVRRAAGGDILIPAAVLHDLVRMRSMRARRQAEHARLALLLTAREHDVLRLMAEGGSNQAIADQLSVSLTTARTHVRTILGKFDAHSKLQAVARAADLGLLPDQHGPTGGDDE